VNSEISFRSVATLQDFEGALWWASTIQENNGVVPEDLRALFNRWCAENDLHKRQRRPWMRTVPWKGRDKPDFLPPGAGEDEE
jgi:hypothetical protein